jgi:hypothetical protein
MLRKVTVLLIFWTCWTAPLAAKPAQVILIRHGEKPPEGHELSLRGRERAAALVPFFQGDERVLEFGTPVAIYAQPVTDKNKSRRPVQTVQALADALKLKVIERFAHEDYAKMVEEILTKPAYDGKMVLVCWEHHVIPDIVKALGVDGPPRWHGDVFDRLWVVRFHKDGAIKFHNLPQKLLYGDTTE